MPDDTTAALQALMQQASKLTETMTDQAKRLDQLHSFNTRILDEKKDMQRQLEARPPKKSIVDIVGDEEYERKMRSANLEKDANGNWHLKGHRPKHSISRTDARDPVKYREAKAAAEAAGESLTVIDESKGDPTRSGRAQVAATKTTVVKDDAERRAYVRQDVLGSSDFRQQYKLLREDGFIPVSWSQPGDLPDHMQTKLRMMENAANAS